MTRPPTAELIGSSRGAEAVQFAMRSPLRKINNDQDASSHNLLGNRSIKAPDNGYYDHLNIVTLINRYWGQRFERSNEFGSVDAIEKFLGIIRHRTFDLPTTQKYFVE